MPDRPVQPLAYFITFRTYSTWLPGDDRGWIGDHQNEFGTEPPAASPELERDNRSIMRAQPFAISPEARAAVDLALRRVIAHRGGTLHALNVRTNHVHIVATVAGPPEMFMNSCKSWATRSLTEAGLIEHGRRVWARHGSTRYLWSESSLADAIGYVRDMQ
jgi:REP element-mobilizing transposase RayT